MEPWIFATLAAALFQTLRFAVQKRLRQTGLSTVGATWARFLWSTPFLVTGLGLWIGLSGVAVPGLSLRFWVFALTGGVAQILATLAVVALFSLRNFAVGITLKKTEVLQTVLVGWVVLGEGVSPWGFAAMLIGLAAIVLLSNTADLGGLRGLWSRAMGLGLGSGAMFALAGVAYRGATLELADLPLGYRAALALACVTVSQTLLMAGWMLWRDRAEVRRVVRHWRLGLAVGLTGLAGSLCWFIAFAEQAAAYVYALGQVELVLSVAGGALFFGERLSRHEGVGIGLLMLSLVGLVLFA